MKRKTRFLIVSFFVIFFLVVTPQIILYSLGYRFDFDQKKFFKTGGIHLRIKPNKVRVFINGKFKKRTRLFLDSVLITNLLPKKQQILVKKEGYHSWQKTLKIDEGKVTKAEHIMLFKKDPLINVFGENIKTFYFSPNEKKVVLETIPEKRLEVLTVESGIKKNVNLKPDQELLDLKWSPGSERFLIKTSPKNSKTENLYLSSSLTDPKLQISLLNLPEKDLGQINFNPQNQNQIFFFQRNNLYVQDLNSNKKIPLKIAENLVSYQVTDKDIIWLSDSGLLHKLNLTDLTGLNIEEKQALNSEVFPLKKESYYKILTNNQLVFLLESNQLSFTSNNSIYYNLFYLNPETKTFQKIKNDIKRFSFSPNKDKIFYSTEHEIWFSDLNDILSSPPDKGKIKEIFLVRFSDKIKNCFWLNPHYLIFTVGNDIKISEIDIRDGLNIINLSKLSDRPTEKTPEIFFSQVYKKIYIYKKDSLFSSEKLIP